MGAKHDVGYGQARIRHVLMVSRRSKTKAWMKRHVSDPFVQEAQKQGYHSRAAFKLIEINDRDKLFKPGMTVIDLGAAPGGWSQIAKEKIGKNGRVIALDILPIAPIPGVITIQGDFNEPSVLDELIAAVDGKADLIISDMAPNLSGQKSIDLPRSIHLLELALDCADQLLRPGGALLIKAFHGPGLEAYLSLFRTRFKSVKFRKPEASRASSREQYVLGVEFKSAP